VLHIRARDAATADLALRLAGELIESVREERETAIAGGAIEERNGSGKGAKGKSKGRGKGDGKGHGRGRGEGKSEGRSDSGSGSACAGGGRGAASGGSERPLISRDL